MKRVALVLLAASTALAQEPDSGERFDTLLGFELNEANLGLIEQMLGRARQFEVPEGHHEFAICYQLRDTSTIVTFSSSDEFGGEDRELLGFSVDSTNSNSSPCATSQVERGEPNVGGIRLGMSQEEFRVIVGDPLRAVTPSSRDRIFLTERKLTAEDYSRMPAGARERLGRDTIDVTLGVAGFFENGVLVRFSVNRVETF